MLELAQLELGYCNISWVFLRCQHSEVVGGANTRLSPPSPGTVKAVFFVASEATPAEGISWQVLSVVRSQTV